MFLMKLRLGRRPQESAGLTWRPISAWWWMLSAAAAVIIVSLIVTVWLLAIAGGANAGTDRANSRLDAVRTGLAAGAGAGAAVGLMLAFRRQYHQEVATDLTNRDATERRITELYTKAVEQLGNNKAPVRLGGLYALERLAQDNPAQHQTIVNVICAYLRMPFASEALPGQPGPEITEAAEASAAGTDASAETLSDKWQQERQVRLTAQRILADHLRINWFEGQPEPGPPGPEFWSSMRLDLTGAILIDLSFYRILAAEARFAGATFIGTAQFYEATLGLSSFQAAKFTQEAAFSRASFTGHADFSKATFAAKSWFSQASFDRDADFNDVTFAEDAMFYGTHFAETAEFQPGIFTGDATFAQATFDGSAWFSSATFARRASFSHAAFNGDVTFQGVTFGGTAEFTGTAFADGAARLPFRETRVLVPSAQHIWPKGWGPMPNRRDEYLLGRSRDVHDP
jgi:Pentapeptide repeats (9 copies)